MSKKDSMIFYEAEITPEQATEYLAESARINRPISEGRVAMLLEQMKANEWLTTHEAVAFDRSGMLIDGQHRLTALVRFGKPLKFTIVEGCDADTFRKIGQGRPRNSGDLFTIEYKSRHGSAPQRASYVVAVAAGMMAGGTQTHHSPEEVAVYALRHNKRILSAILTLYKTPGGKNAFGTPTIAACVRVALYFGEDRVEPIMWRLGEQKWGGAGDPLKVLYDRLMKSKLAEGYNKRTQSLSRAEQYLLSVGALRLALQGKTTSRVEIVSKDVGEADVDKQIKNGTPGTTPRKVETSGAAAS
jgi:hypothetical protein